jgi:ABC-2 type transport system ATP-binding protein/lipopolysaccharide transport system ATP-binding protein
MLRFDDIVEFAGVAEFLDTPLKRYSAGMQLRLAFSVAAHLEPDIVLVDEVLAVGDLDFQQRCLTRMSELGREGRTVMFVSHDLGAVRRLCPRSIWIDSAEVRADGPSPDVIAKYVARHGASSSSVALPARPGQAIDVQWAGVTDADGKPGEPLSGESFFVRAHLGVRERIRDLDAALYINNAEGVRVVDEAWSESGRALLPDDSLQPHEIFIEVPGSLVPGEYFVGVWVSSEDECFFFEEVMAFRVLPQPTDRPASLDKTRIVACRGGLQARVLEQVRGADAG